MAAAGGDVQAGQWCQGQRLGRAAAVVIAAALRTVAIEGKGFKETNKICN
jgi:hypothetical protein